MPTPNRELRRSALIEPQTIRLTCHQLAGNAIQPRRPNRFDRQTAVRAGCAASIESAEGQSLECDAVDCTDV
jgi:hypothetical protein